MHYEQRPHLYSYLSEVAVAILTIYISVQIHSTIEVMCTLLVLAFQMICLLISLQFSIHQIVYKTLLACDKHELETPKVVQQCHILCFSVNKTLIRYQYAIYGATYTAIYLCNIRC